MLRNYEAPIPFNICVTYLVEEEEEVDTICGCANYSRAKDIALSSKCRQ